MRPRRGGGWMGTFRNAVDVGSGLYRDARRVRQVATAIGVAGTAAAEYLGYGGGADFSGASGRSGGGYRIRSGETKYHETIVGISPVSATGTVPTSLNLVPVGTSATHRVGMQFRIVGIQLQGVAHVRDTSGTSQADVLRCVLYWDKQCNGTAAAVTDILETAYIYSHNNLENALRFKTLAQFTISLQPEGVSGTTTTNVKRHFKRNIRCSIPIVMDTGTSITDVRSNNVGIMFISNNAKVGVQYQTRIRFKDD